MSESTKDVYRNVMLPIAIILLTFAAVGLLNIVGMSLRENSEVGVLDWLKPLCLTAVAACAFITERQKKGKAFFFSVFSGCAACAIVDIAFFIEKAASFSIVYLFNILTSLPFIIGLFLWFRYRKSLITESDKKNNDALVMIGTFLIANGLLSVFNQTLRTYAPDFWTIVMPVIQILAGIGLLARDRFLGIFGMFVLLAITLIKMSFLLKSPHISSVLAYINMSAIKIVLIALFLTVLSKAFNNNFYSSLTESMNGGSSSSGYRTTTSYPRNSKSCGQCGKPVSLSASVGQRCPHCGAYWGGERNITNKVDY